MDARGLPWGVQWEIARLISLKHCEWDDISMSALDVLRTEGLSPPDPDDPDTPTSTPAVLNAQIGPYIEDLLRWNKHTFGSQRRTKEVLSTVRSRFPRPVIHTNICPACPSHLGKNSTRRILPSSGMALQAAWVPHLNSGTFTAARCPFACGCS